MNSKKMVQKKKNPNNHKLVTRSTSGENSKSNYENFTSYDTKKVQTSTPQKVREESEASAQQRRLKKQKGDSVLQCPYL